MRGRGLRFILIAVLAVAALPETADAQLSPRGIIGEFTRPLRHMLGRFGHVPGRRARAAQDRAAAPAQNPSGVDVLAGWPTAYQEILGFTFWPGEYVQQVHSHGFDVIAAAVLKAPHKPVQTATTGAGDASAETTSCASADATQGNWLAGRIEQTVVDLTPAQRDALNTLKTALAQSVKAIDAACQDTTSPSPINRLDAATQYVWAVHDAGIYVRAPLETFYNSLTAAQKKKFEWTQRSDQPDAKSANSEMGKQYQACAARGAAASEQLLKQIEQEVRPNNDQAASMEALRQSTSEMVKMLSASCAQAIPAAPLARLDSAGVQLSRLSYAATSEQIALNNFYAALDADQKAKFDSLGR
jgi:hypothetical protein